MKLTFLGTGSAMPTGERNQTGLLLSGNGGEASPDTLLVDCGSGVLNALAATDVGYEGVERVLLTHHHLDHVSDLMALAKARWLAGEESLTVIGPPGTEDLVAGLFDVHAYMQDRLELTVREVDPGSFSVGDFAASAVETEHSMYCLAYRFEPTGVEDPPAVTYSGDTEAVAAVADLADGSALLVHDCSFPDEVDVSNHPTPSRLGDVLAGHEYGRVYLTHLYPHTDGKHEEMVDSVTEGYDGDVRVARDGLSVTVE